MLNVEMYNRGVMSAVNYHLYRAEIRELLNVNNNLKNHKEAAKDLLKLKKQPEKNPPDYNSIDNINSYNLGVYDCYLYHFNKFHQIKNKNKEITESIMKEFYFHERAIANINDMNVRK